jgi:hypothetical protein
MTIAERLIFTTPLCSSQAGTKQSSGVARPTYLAPLGSAGLPSDHVRTGMSRSRTGEFGSPAVPSMIVVFTSPNPHRSEVPRLLRTTWCRNEPGDGGEERQAMRHR